MQQTELLVRVVSMLNYNCQLMSESRSTPDRDGLPAVRNPDGSLNNVNSDTRATRMGKNFTRAGTDPSRSSGNGPLRVLK